MKQYCSIIFLFCCINFFAQKEANFWYFGQNAGLDFSSGFPVAVNDGQLNTDEGCSTISDKNGNLLFYSDGIILYNANHQVMQFSNGISANNLGGNPSSTQSALFVPNPRNENLYYLFTIGTPFVGVNGTPNSGFKFYTIDKTKNNGLGEIIAGPVNLSVDPNTGNDISDFFSEKVTAVQGNCNSIWVLSAVDNQFYAFEISETGVNTTPVISTTNYRLVDKRGYLKISPDGTKLALADFSLGGGLAIGNGRFVLYDFDAISGTVSRNTTILTTPSIDGSPYGVEFSQQSNKLYVSTFSNNTNTIFQFDLTQNNIASSKYRIYTQPGFRGALQLGVDGKIYASIPGKTTLDRIENPNDIGQQVRYTENAVSLNGAIATEGLPPFIQSFFAPVNIVNSDNTSVILSNNLQEVCIGDVINIEPELEENPGQSYNYLWTKEGSSISLTSRKISITNDNFGSGIYNLEITTEDECEKLKTFNSSIEIRFNPKPIVNQIAVYEQCDFDNNTTDFTTSFNLTTRENDLYAGTEDVVIDFFETDDTSFSNPVNKENYRNSKPTDNTNGNHKLIVRVTNNNSECFDFGEIELKVNPTGIATYNDIFISELDANRDNSNSFNSLGTGNGFIDFDKKTNEITINSRGALSTSTHNFQYYPTLEDAGLQINEFTKPYEGYTFTDQETVFIRISLKGSNSCESIGEFTVNVRELPEPLGNLTPLTLCTTNPEIVPEPNSVLLDGSTNTINDQYQWFRNGFLIDGATNATYETNEEGTFRVEAYRNYENDPSNNSDNLKTTGFNTHTVIKSNNAVVTSFRFLDNQDNPQENTITINVTGKGDYEYALNSDDLSAFTKGEENLSFTFTNVPPGLNTVFIRDRNGCDTVASERISFIQVQNHFSPNGDGILDTWKIQGVDNDFYVSVNLQIFDRFGALLKKIDLKTSNGWNGFYQGKLLPQNDYWFTATLIDVNGNVRKETGHFSLISR